MVYRSPQLDLTFAALADPTRREILSRLSTRDRTISELAARFDMSLPAVSKHVRVLQKAGLAEIELNGRVRTARLKPAPMRGALEWIERYRRFWESELELLARYLENTSEDVWTEQAQAPRRPTTKQRQSSKSGASSARRSSVSSTRGHKRKN